MIDAILAAATAATPDSGHTQTIMAIGGLIAGVLGAFLGYRGQSKSSKVTEMAGIFQGQDMLIKNLQEELERCQHEHHEVLRHHTSRYDQSQDALDECAKVQRQLREELRRVLSDFAGLRMVVNSEVAKSAAQTSEEIARKALRRLDKVSDLDPELDN